MKCNKNNPFEKIDPTLLDTALVKYPAIAELYSRRLKRVVSRGVSFYSLPRLIQWLIVGSDIAQLKLETINKVFTYLNKKDPNLDKKIKEWAQFTQSHNSLFNFLTEFIVIYNILQNNVSDFSYEERCPNSSTVIDVNVKWNEKLLRLEITHKEDSYTIQDTCEILQTNLKYIFPEYGGEILYPPPYLHNIHTKQFIKPNNLTSEEIKEFLHYAFKLGDSRKHDSMFEIPCPRPFFKINVDPSSPIWVKKLIDDSFHTYAWPSPDINGYFHSINRKLEKFNNMNDDSYKIIAIDFIPGSYFHDDNYYREELYKKIIEDDFIQKSNVDEVVTFTARFETGFITMINPLWLRDLSGGSLFEAILNGKNN